MPTRKPVPTLEERSREGDYPCALMECSDFVLATLGSAVSLVLDTALRSYGLRMRTYRMLRILDGDGPQPQSRLGAVLGLDRTTTVQQVDELEALGLAKRERSPDDRRSYRIALTAKGKRTVAKAIARVEEAEATIFEPLSAAERRALQNLATRLLTDSDVIAGGHRRAVASLTDRRRS